jgi:hypothetical protein
MSTHLPPSPSLEQLKKQAKTLLRHHGQSDAQTFERIRKFHPQLSGASDVDIAAAEFGLQDAQLLLAREYGFDSWPKMAAVFKIGAGELPPARTDGDQIPNPYIIGAPVGNRHRQVFFGRESDFAAIRKRLLAQESGSVTFLVGQARRIGKTSMLLQIANGRLGREILPVFVDMQQLVEGGNREFFEGMTRLIADSCELPQRYDFSSGNPAITFDRVLADAQRAVPEKRLLLLFDEIPILVNKVEKGELDEAVLTYLLSTVESRGVSFIFTNVGVDGSVNGATGAEGEWRGFAERAECRVINFLSKEDTLRLVREPVQDRFEHESETLEGVYELSGGHPYYTQLICSCMVDYLNQPGRSAPPTPDDLAAVVDAIVDNPPPQLVNAWSLTEGEQMALRLMGGAIEHPGEAVSLGTLGAALSPSRSSDGAGPQDLQAALDALRERELVGGEADGYCFSVDLLRRWIRRGLAAGAGGVS